MIPCGLADCHTLHKNGFVVAYQTEGGQNGEGMVGHVCGAKFFGTGWKEAVRRHEQRERVARIREWAASTLSDCEFVEPRLTRLVEIRQRLDRARIGLAERTPRFFRFCQEAARSRNGWLLIRGGPIQMTGHTFWTREDTWPKTTTLAREIGAMRMAIRDAYISEAALGTMLSRFGSARERALELARGVATDIGAIALEAIDPVVDAYRESERADDVRVESAKVKAPEVTWRGWQRNETWRLVVDLTAFRSKARDAQRILEELEDGADALVVDKQFSPAMQE